MGRRGNAARKGRRPLFLAGIGFLLLLGLAWFQLRPTVEAAAAYQTQVFAARIVNSAVQAELNREDTGYGELVKITRNAAGDIASLQADTAAINRLKAQVTGSVIGELEEMGLSSLQLHLGTLVGNEFTAGHGPQVEMKVQPVGYVETDLVSRFSAAGINQTHHQISLTVVVELQAVLPGYHIRCRTETSYLLAETVIVGHIPDTYLQLDGGGPFLQKLAKP